jgi:hypothetical protein
MRLTHLPEFAVPGRGEIDLPHGVLALGQGCDPREGVDERFPRSLALEVGERLSAAALLSHTICGGTTKRVSGFSVGRECQRSAEST